MGDFALQLWNEHSGAFTLSNGQQWENDPVTCSLNCWPGELAYFWIERIRWRYIHDPGSWNGFDADEKMRFIISSKMKVIFRALFGQHYL